MARKTYASMGPSVIRTFERVVTGLGWSKSGGQRPWKYSHRNGAEIWVIGLDKPDRLLSSEWDFIYVNQAEELSEADWEFVTSRCTGRGSIVEHPQTFGDCNPSGRKHWIREHARQGRLRLLVTTHKDNPVLYTAAGEVTPEGRKQLDNLASSLSGVRFRRLMEGEWATAEGAVYDIFSEQIHVKDRSEAEFSRFALTIDVGYTNPSVVLLVGIDSDGRWHVCREFYKRNVLEQDLVGQALAWFKEKQCEVAVVDEADPMVVAALRNGGVHAVGEKGVQDRGISAVRTRLKVQGDGRPRLTLAKQCVETQNEFESYVLKPGTDKPIKEHDHAMDALRYLAVHYGEASGAIAAAEPQTPQGQGGQAGGFRSWQSPRSAGFRRWGA